ncbi:MAG: hypothetical protein ACRYGG_18715 [Janthinobacterium lividum]
MSFDFSKFILILVFFLIFVYPLLKVTKYKKNFDSLLRLSSNGVDYVTGDVVLLQDDNLECGSGKYLGSDNIIQNCRDICHTNLVSYHYITDEVVVNAKGEKLEKGAWCLPRQFHTCNLAISNVIKSDSRWRCLPKYPLFGGVDGNQILKCGGLLKDNRNDIIYKDVVPSNFKLSSLDETVTVTIDGRETVKYAIECAPTKDVMGNELIDPQLGDRFDRIRNYCAKFIPNADKSLLPNFEKNECPCTLHLENLYHNKSRACIPCKTTIDDKVIRYQTPCYAEKTLTDEMDPEEIIFTCGIKQFYNQKIGCITTTIERQKM